ncbi:hypothetical protein B0H17DRAFT_950602 [Mycena rosella]|uniref:F-box domain-containing protein n=1 Tax=Mycena rosella TaxID=1033263 RepID=A0AAD7G541_MYCRO|nr:hypothetical protein B0H17DRAFT_950602 [Mycena rosella]
MHSSLRISELLERIFSHFDHRLATDNGTLAALARTCTAFHDIAVDTLWRHQDTIINLISCMPGDLWETVAEDGWSGRKMVRLGRPIIVSDWDRLLKYSSRVRSLTCTGSSFQPDLSEIFDAIHLHFPENI